MNTLDNRIIILDTTLRDGCQNPGFDFSLDDKMRIAEILEKLGLDIIEVGFPASSQSQFSEVRELSSSIRHAAVSAMARALPEDIEKAGRALEYAPFKHIHTFIATSDIHLAYKLRKTRGEVLAFAVDSVRTAREFADSVEIGAEDATRTEHSFLLEFCIAVTEAGADVVNISDTIGYAQPSEYERIIAGLASGVPALRNGTSRLSVHCHNDLGLATANTLAGIKAGALQAEVTLLGIGERAGNASIEEVVMAIKTRPDHYHGLATGINSKWFTESARLLARIAGMEIPPIKPVVGKNAYSHASGIHQQAMAANESTYSLIAPSRTGSPPFRIVIGRYSGSSGLRLWIRQLTGKLVDNIELAVIQDWVKNNSGAWRCIPSAEILMLLKNRGIIDTNIWKCDKLTYSLEEDNGVTMFSFAIGIVNQSGNQKRIERRGKTKWVTLSKAFAALFRMDVSIIEFTFSGSGNDEENSGRLYLSCKFDNEIYYEEGYGEDQVLLFADCYVNIVNQIIARFQFQV